MWSLARNKVITFINIGASARPTNQTPLFSYQTRCGTSLRVRAASAARSRCTGSTVARVGCFECCVCVKQQSVGRSCTRVRLFCFYGCSVPHANSVLDRRLRLPDSRSEQTTGIESVLTVSIPSHRCTTFGIAAPHPVDGSTAAPSIATGTAGAPKAAGFGVLHQSAALRHRRLRIVRRNLLLFGVPSLPKPSSVDCIDQFSLLPCLRPFRHTVRTIRWL
jgi:hypothetical protein